MSEAHNSIPVSVTPYVLLRSLPTKVKAPLFSLCLFLCPFIGPIKNDYISFHKTSHRRFLELFVSMGEYWSKWDSNISNVAANVTS
jgi:hypothetical protein